MSRHVAALAASKLEYYVGTAAGHVFAKDISGTERVLLRARKSLADATRGIKQIVVDVVSARLFLLDTKNTVQLASTDSMCNLLRRDAFPCAVVHVSNCLGVRRLRQRHEAVSSVHSRHYGAEREHTAVCRRRRQWVSGMDRRRTEQQCGFDCYSNGQIWRAGICTRYSWTAR